MTAGADSPKGAGDFAPPVLLALAVALAVAAYLRIPPTGSALLFGDEFHTLRRLDTGYLALASTFGRTGSGMALPLLQRGLVDLFGSSHWTLRAPALLAGLALVASLYPMGRRLVGRDAALVGTFLAAVSSPLVYYSHFGRSYALAALLSLWLVYLLQGLLDEGGEARGQGGRLAGCAVLIALLPYVHLTAAALVTAVVAATLGALWLEDRRSEVLRLALFAALGGAASLLLHVPALESFLAFVSEKTERSYFGDFGFLDVAALLAGGRWTALGAIPVLVWALARFARAKRARSLPLLAGCLAPGLAVALLRPYGDAYAWARYALSALPFACLAVGWGIAGGGGGPRRRAAVWASGAALALLLWFTGPYGSRHTPDGPFANTYVSLLPLPAFDEPWPEAPAFYARLAGSERPPRIIEVPGLVSRTRHLYRNHYLQHGAETRLAFLPEELPTLPQGPYVDLGDPAWRETADADFLILHLAIADEVRAYWRFVYEDQRAAADAPAVAAYMQRHSRYGQVPAASRMRWVRKQLARELGDPVYEDRWVAAWKLGR